MGKGKVGVVDGAASLVCALAYVAYVAVGIAIFICGIVYFSQIADANQCESKTTSSFHSPRHLHLLTNPAAFPSAQSSRSSSRRPAS